MTASASVAGATAFAAGTGVATFFAPCAFPLLPGYVGYYVAESDSDTAVLAAAAAAAVGAVTAIAAVAGLVLAVGQPARAALPVLEPVIGVGLVGFGALVVAGRGPQLHVALPERPSSVLGFGAFGAVYAVAAAGCVVPLFVGVVAQALALPAAGATVVLGAYAGGVAAPLVGVTLLAGAGVEAWRDLGAHAGSVQRAAGAVMVLAGLGQLYLSVVELNVLGVA
ncbi:cytochrome c biogenesis protein CcdA [Halobacterium jilantaiense]|uniref:Cytochrome c-type biogenesis protein n=1 Tax=Halobacterium jilantaiense TaxID=355548 RepID=A0A1I0P5Y2_9EURY|nr:cytochrome c biogenesis protein CcdA [Halobacterium jilantaiense]SEW09595.1 cytochrome c-type biogenesis protein [Halobacterium jilantaiense]